MIRAEAEKLERPAVADLGSGGGVLTTGLRDLASVIHCVDNSEGMVADVDSGGCVRPQLGEVTDSGLPDASIDLVVCARVIEYLFWPDLLADEIRRIAKPGATYFVTFPADRGEYAPRDGPPPDRIRRYFTADDIERWASRIGPGRLHAVQYDAAEPTDGAAEDRYRARERSAPPAIAPPTGSTSARSKPPTIDSQPRARPPTLILTGAFAAPAEPVRAAPLPATAESDLTDSFVSATTAP